MLSEQQVAVTPESDCQGKQIFADDAGDWLRWQRAQLKLHLFGKFVEGLCIEHHVSIYLSRLGCFVATEDLLEERLAFCSLLFLLFRVFSRRELLLFDWISTFEV